MDILSEDQARDLYPVVALFGRPGSGKTTLGNYLAGKKISENGLTST
jgi:ABC-type molybdate transport system ATPase subunit